MSKRGFICAGCWTIDRIKQIDAWPREEELARIVAIDRQGGGSAHNVGINLRQLDPSLPVATIGMLGVDDDGNFLMAQASRHGIDTTMLLRTDQQSTSYTDVMSVQNTGKRTFFHHTGANDLLGTEHFNFQNSDKRILHLGLLSLHAQLDANQGDGRNGWSTVLQRAQIAGIATSIEMVSIDPLRNRQLAAPCLAHIDYLVLNDHEIGAIAGCATLVNGETDVDACLQAATDVLGEGNMTLVVVHYPKGAVCVTRSGEQHVTTSLPIPQAQIKGTVGAGDAFVAGFLYGMHEQWPVSQALELGHVVAAASLRSVTTVGAVETIARCRAFAETLDPI